MQYFCTVKPNQLNFIIMKRLNSRKLKFDDLSNERKQFYLVLSYVLDRVVDPYCDDKLFRSDDTCPDVSSYYLHVINEELQEL